MASDLEIARAIPLRPIQEIAGTLGIHADAIEPYGRFKAKLGPQVVRSVETQPDGALILVTGINPTPAGEGKTTTTIGLGDALNASGHRTVICLREPSLGPCFGVKGGATGGGRAQIAPMEEINLHFTGDFHAITSANNLLAAMLDNHMHWGNALGLDPRRLTWRRTLDMNDRALRQMAIGLGGTGNGVPREEHFDITVASEVMAVFCLASDLHDLQRRLARIVVGARSDGSWVTAKELGADGAMAALLREALSPNLVQTLEGSPALVHGGPFANIAHGCSSVIATRLGLKLADFVVTEAGFGADLGAEKFFDIKCRSAGLSPACCVVVATLRALKMHGGVARADLSREDPDAVQRGLPNLLRHVENVGKFGVPVVVALNHFTSDTVREFEIVDAALGEAGVEVVSCTHWAKGAAGAGALARAVLTKIASGPAHFAPLYPSDLPLVDKIETVARQIYRAGSVDIPQGVRRRLAGFEQAGFGAVPVCIAKTPYSFSADPARLGAPTDHVFPIRDVQLSAGAGFVVALSGDVMTMPGLPRKPAAEGIYLDEAGLIQGLF
jgi:formate--tetrahydrofolate ligase